MSSVKVLFFARLREQMGMAAIEIPITASITLGQLREQLGQQYTQFATLRGPVMAAVNQDFAQDHVQLHADDEVAFFPPVTGG